MKWHEVTKVDKQKGQQALDDIVGCTKTLPLDGDKVHDNPLDAVQTMQLLALMLINMACAFHDETWCEWDFEEQLDDMKANGLIS